VPWFEVIVADGFPIGTVSSFPLNERGEGFLGRRPSRSFEPHIRTAVSGTVVAHERQRRKTDNHDHAKHCDNDHSGTRLHPLSVHVPKITERRAGGKRRRRTGPQIGGQP
jgi:hypothetical protein